MTPSRVPLQPQRKAGRLVASMFFAVGVVAALSYLDESREATAALEAFGEAQASLAQSVASDLSTRLDGIRNDAILLADGSLSAGALDRISERYLSAVISAPGTPPRPGELTGQGVLLSVPLSEGRRVDFVVPLPMLFAGGSRVERPNGVSVLFLRPGSTRLLTTDGREVSAGPLTEALEGGLPVLRVTGPEAAQLSLPNRTALAGLSRVNAGALGPWGVAVIATAQAMRDREARGRWRLFLAVVLAGGLVLAFGGLALRQQRKELLLGRELAVAAVQRDRDERLERVSKAATMMTLASGMAHELSTPLGAIVGRAEQLASRAAIAHDERAARSVGVILEQSERISQIVRGFLNLARGGAPSLSALEPFAVAKSAASLVEHRFATRGVLLEVTVPDGLPPVQGDPRLMEHALVNLLLNACDACPRGGHVLLGASADVAGLSFTVTDNGSGISPEHAARVTEPFFTTKEPEKGTGLGLAITNEIMKSHRGSLTIAPAVPRGTCATLQIPFATGAIHGQA